MDMGPARRPVSPSAADRAPPGAFARLGRFVVRRPWPIIAVWVVLALLALPLLPHLSGAETSSATELPSSAPSSQASAELAHLFPNNTYGSTSLIVLTGANVTSFLSQTSVIHLTSAINSDPGLTELTGVNTLYTGYSAYLAGQAEGAVGVIGATETGSPSLVGAVNLTADATWTAAATFLQEWNGLRALNPSAPASTFNWPAYNQTHLALQGQPPLEANLSLLYYGDPGASPANGFNGSADCAAAPSSAAACVDGVMRSVLPAVGVLNGPPSQVEVESLALLSLGVENYTSWGSVQSAVAHAVGPTEGLTPGWMLTVWDIPADERATPAALSTWATGVVAGTSLYDYPLPIPVALRDSFVDAADNVTVLELTFSAGDQGPATWADVDNLSSLIPRSLAQSDPDGTLHWVQTGDDATSLNENTVINSDVNLVLPATFGVLILIIILYFRAPLAPIVTLVGLGIALLLGFAGVVLVGTLVTKVNPTALSLLTTFVLGVGTDYSVFLLARYREELNRGHTHEEAVVTAVTWAGESLATSGTTVLLATIALALSGAALLSQWGMVLSVGLAAAILLSLTMTPALITLIGPRIFWPSTGERARRDHERAEKRSREGQTYFHKAGRTAARHPMAIVLVVLLLSIPAVYLALNVPLAYDYFGQLPASQPAAQGLQIMASNFGPGTTFPSQVLVTWSAPLVAGGHVNAAEFAQMSYIAQRLSATPGVARVSSPFGLGGAPLTTWLALDQLPPVTEADLNATLAGYVGTDGRTVLYTVVPSSSGLSNAAVDTLNHIEANVSDYTSSHLDITATAYGGAASLVKDLQAQLAIGTERMALAVVIGLLVVLFLVLGSAILPPLAIATIGLSIGWAWALTYLLLGVLAGLPLFFYVPVIVFIVILGLGMDYNVFILTRVREERLRGRSSREAVLEAVANTGGIITAAALILAGAFFVLATAQTTLLRAIGLAVGLAVILDAMIVRTYLVPALMTLLGDRVWWAPKAIQRLRHRKVETAPAPSTPGGSP